MRPRRTTMICHLTRWFISRSEDGGKAWPRFAERHAARCAACREYARFASALSARLSAEVPSLLARVPEPALTFDGLDAEGTPSENRAPSGRRPVFLRPLPVASVALALVALALILTLVVLREPGPSPSDRQAALTALKSITAAPGELGGAVIDVESSLDREREILERSILSALDYLQERLNIKIERRDRPKSL
jgi:hypothetical protein